MQTIRALILGVFLSALLLPGCASIQVRSDYDDTTDFGKYQTFRMLDRKGPRQAAPGMNRLNRLVAEDLKRELEARGLRAIAQGPPDLLVGFHTDVKNRISVTEEWYPYRWRGPRRSVSVDSYKEGTLVVDLIDRAAEAVVWRGWATGAFRSPEEAEAKVHKAVVKVLEQFPPE